MPSHRWGNHWFEEHGRDLEDAISEIAHICRKYGRIGINSKEKYGSHRCTAYFWDGGLHSLIWPGYARVMNHFIYFKLDWYLMYPIMKYSGLLYLFTKYQQFIYNYAFQMACKKYPKIIDELVADVDDFDLIKPGIFGKVDGLSIHRKYWREV